MRWVGKPIQDVEDPNAHGRSRRQRTGMDPVELRRKNFIQPEQFPYFISNGNLYNSGNYEGVLDKVLELTDFEFWHEEQRRLREGEGR